MSSTFQDEARQDFVTRSASTNRLPGLGEDVQKVKDAVNAILPSSGESARDASMSDGQSTSRTAWFDLVREDDITHRRSHAPAPGSGLAGRVRLSRRLTRSGRRSKGQSAMNLPREHQLLLTRRQLFGRTATGIGTAALASLLNPAMFSTPVVSAAESRPRRAAGAGLLGTHGALRAPLRPEGQARHLPRHVRRPVAHRPVRLQAGAAADPRQGAARPRSGWASG